jgi:hypothetical protein
MDLVVFESAVNSILWRVVLYYPPRMVVCLIHE